MIENNDIVSHTETKTMMLISDAIRNYMDTSNREPLDLIFGRYRENPSLYKRLFPTAVDEATQQLHINKIRLLAFNEEELIKAHAQIQIDLIKSEGNNFIVSMRASRQEQLISFVNKKVLSITKSIRESEREVVQMLAEDKKEAKECYGDDEECYEIAITAARRRTAAHLSMTEELIAGAKKSLMAPFN